MIGISCTAFHYTVLTKLRKRSRARRLRELIG
jgi:hypothetical protein